MKVISKRFSKKTLLLLLLCFVAFLVGPVGTYVYVLSNQPKTLAQDSRLRVSSELKRTVRSLAPNDSLLIWLDVYIPPLPDGNIYLSRRDISPITDLGAKIAGITFSPDNQLLWYLLEVEARAEEVSSLANLTMVQKVSLARIGVWDWWDKPWWKVTPVDPLLDMAGHRLIRNFAGAKIQVVINYDDASSQKEKSKQEIINEISALVGFIGGRVVHIGLAEYVLAEVPPSMLNLLLANKHVTTLEALRPIYLR